MTEISKALASSTYTSALRNIGASPQELASGAGSTRALDIGGMRGWLTGMEGVTEALSRAAIAHVVERGVALAKASAEDWKQFVDDPFWEEHSRGRPKLNGQALAVKFLLRLAYHDHPRATKRSSDAWKVVEQLQREGVEPELLRLALIKESSLRAVRDRASRPKAGNPALAVGSKSTKSSKSGASVKPMRVESGSATRAKGSRPKGRVAVPLGPTSITLTLQVTEEQLSELMACGSQFTVKTTLEISAVGGSGMDAKLLKLKKL